MKIVLLGLAGFLAIVAAALSWAAFATSGHRILVCRIRDRQMKLATMPAASRAKLEVKARVI